MHTHTECTISQFACCLSYVVGEIKTSVSQCVDNGMQKMSEDVLFLSKINFHVSFFFSFLVNIAHLYNKKEAVRTCSTTTVIFKCLK